MSKFMSYVFWNMVKKRRNDILVKEIDISTLMFHAQKIKKKNQREGNGVKEEQTSSINSLNRGQILKNILSSTKNL